MRGVFRAMTLMVSVGMLSLTGCVFEPAQRSALIGEESKLDELTDEEYYDLGLERFIAVREALVPVQRKLHDGMWRTYRYGAGPGLDTCKGGKPGYRHSISVGVKGLDLDISHTSEEMLSWLREEGWQSAGVAVWIDSEQGDAMLTLTASGDPTGLITRLTVLFRESPGSVTLGADSICFHGDSRRLRKMIFPDTRASTPIYPEEELPGVAPVFRFAIENGTASDDFAALPPATDGEPE